MVEYSPWNISVNENGACQHRSGRQVKNLTVCSLMKVAPRVKDQAHSYTADYTWLLRLIQFL